MYRILIADDEPIERMVISKIIRDGLVDEFEIDEAANGREAVELFEKKKYEIVILDIEMPGVNGLEAAEKIRKMDKYCTIIFLTAFDEFDYAKKAITVKALDYLLKPSSDEEIISTLEEAIRLIQEEKRGELHGKEQGGIENSGLENTGWEKLERIRTDAVREEILQFIENHYIEDISLQNAAEAMNYSDAYFCKLFKQCFHKSFTSYLSEYRMEKAKQMLLNITINVKDISDRVGYHDSNYFTKVFKRIVGMTPSEYRILFLEK